MLVSRRKFYLSGSDWGINAVDYLMKRRLGAGNVCQLVLLLKSPVSEGLLGKHLNRFMKKFPLLQGRIARDFKLTPYWKIPASMKMDATLTVSQLNENATDSELFELLQRSANSPFCHDKEYLDFHLFNSSGRSALAIRFDHRLFDGRGIESFMSLFQDSLADDSISGDIRFESSMELSDWKSKFMAGRNLNRRFIEFSESTPRSFPLDPAQSMGFRCRQLCFDKAETAAIYEKAYREAGYLMESPFLLAAITSAINDLFAARGSSEGEFYLVPVTVDARPGRKPLQEIFFNRMSYLFYRIPVEEAADIRNITVLLKQQMYEQVKSGFPKDMSEASLLARILPLRIYGKLLHLPVKGKIATFAFSHLGKSFYRHEMFMESQVENLFHMPRVPFPPGIGLFSNLYNGRLNLAISYLDGIITEAELDRLERAIRVNTGAVAQ